MNLINLRGNPMEYSYLAYLEHNRVEWTLSIYFCLNVTTYVLRHSN